MINLPYPMIRWPVAKVAPMLLLPSFMQMDHNYRQAIIYTEQADQLINNATSAQDFELGADKAEQAQQHLDKLPVWFLGYYPQRYCAWFNCGWQFTLDEFEDARALIGRMDAQIFNLEQVKERQTLEKRATQTLQQVNDRVVRLVQTRPDQSSPSLLAELQSVINQLDAIPQGTTVYADAQQLLIQAENQLKILQ